MNLYNDDCFNKMKQMVAENIKVDAIICDPPYNINYENNEWDNSFNIEWALYLCKQLLKPNGNLILFQGWTNVCETKLLCDKYFSIQNWIIWDRIKGRGAKNNLMSTREDILWYCNGDTPTYNKIYSNIQKKTSGMGSKNGQVNRSLTNVWYDISPIIPWGEEHTEHPTQKPVELMERIIKIFTNEDDLVLDFTMGSGTTGVACKMLNRDFIGIELDKTYYDIAENRINMEQKGQIANQMMLF